MANPIAITSRKKSKDEGENGDESLVSFFATHAYKSESWKYQRGPTSVEPTLDQPRLQVSA